MLLHVVYPADVWDASGIETEVPLFCLLNDTLRINKTVSKVLIRVITTDPLAIEEINILTPDDSFGVNVFVVTKISGCNDAPVYVAEYINDVLPYVNCCLPAPLDSNLWIDFDDGLFLNHTNGGIYYK